MGQQPSKKAAASADSSSQHGDRRSIDGMEAYPSFNRSETKESSRSLRGSIRSKIPGTAKPDGTKDSPTSLDDGHDVERLDGASASSSIGARSGSSRHRRSRSGSSTRPPLANPTPPPPPPPPPPPARLDSPPPSPMRKPSSPPDFEHRAVDQARRSGEVGNISDLPLVGTIHPSNQDHPKESILLKKVGLANPSPGPTPDESIAAASTTMEIGALRTIDLDDMITRLLDAGYAGKVTKGLCLKNAEVTAICTAVREVFLSQPALVELSPPVKIVGDVHGQYTDLIRMFEMCGFPPNANYLFLGDYVDRGKQSLETILLLLCYKLKFPENFFLLRGNHECANVTRIYGFYDECKRRCNIKIWKTFVDTFNCLPIAAIVAGKIFCVHGGLSPALSHMDDIRQIARPTDVPDYGLLNDLLWSDPAEMDTDWESNERGVSFCFGKKVIMDFLQRHDFDLVCRAHMVVEDGYEFFNDRILVTVFSAPNVRHLFLSPRDEDPPSSLADESARPVLW